MTANEERDSAVCPECGCRVQIGPPRGGDGSADVYFRHRDPVTRQQCGQSRRIASPDA